jgi:hypothetical protein
MSAPKLMINPDLVPSPFTFNPLKHHLGFIRQLLEYAASGENEAEVINLINTIGPQLTDIYYGEFSVEYILEEIKSILLQLSCFKMEPYEKWARCPCRPENRRERAGVVSCRCFLPAEAGDRRKLNPANRALHGQ